MIQTKNNQPGCQLINMKSLTEETYQLFDQAYDFFNLRLFDNMLPQCIITFQRQPRLMGYASFSRWMNQEKQYVDELAINPEYFANYPLSEIFQTLCHEMVHIWQQHFGRPSRRGYHNKEWSDKMIAIGLMPSSTGKPGGDLVGQTMMDYVIDDGKFIQVCNELVQDGFEIKWIDTFPVPNKQKAGEKLLKHYQAIPPRETQVNEILEPEQSPVSMEVLENAFQATFNNDLSTDLPISPSVKISTSKPKRTSGRNKYYCANCFIGVWGKPGLNIKCGDCDSPLIEDD